MKTRVLSILLTLCMALSTVYGLIPQIVLADDSTNTEEHIDLNTARIYVGQQRISNYNLSGPGWRFDKATDTLILNGFSLGGISGSYPMGEESEDIYKTAYIFVGGGGVNLKIRSEGSQENWFGGYECMGEAATVIYDRDGYWIEQYCHQGIYNPNGTVTFSGSTPLNIYSHLYGIKANEIRFESGTNVTVNSYADSINANHDIFLEKDCVVKAHSYSSGDAFFFATHAVRGENITVSKNAELYAEIERMKFPVSIGPVSAVFGFGDINVLGGKLTGIVRDDGKLGYKSNCYNIGVMAQDVLNIDNGGEVNSYVYNTSRKNYTGSAAISGYQKTTDNVKFSGSGILRTGVQMSRPKGAGSDSFELIHAEKIEYGDFVHSEVTDKNYRPKGFEDFGLYKEITATASDGIFLKDGGDKLVWSYYSNYKAAGSILKPNPEIDMDNIISGGELRPVLANHPNVPVTIQSGKFYLNTSDDDGKPLSPGTIEIKKGAELIILGGGKIDNLDVCGQGKITFLGSTVKGKVDKSVTMVVAGGNIFVDYEGTATDRDGAAVFRGEYVLTSDETTYEQVTYVYQLDGRDYGSAGLYPFNGKKVYLWLRSTNNISHVSAIQNDDHYGYTLYPTSSNVCMLEKKQIIEVNDRPFYVAVPDQDVQLIPFKSGSGHANRYDLSWSFSDDGYTWYGIYTAIGNDGELSLTGVYDAWCNRMYRCEIRSKADGSLLGIYNTTLYIYDPTFSCDGGFVDGKEVTVRFTPKRQPGISSCNIFGIFWGISKDGGSKKSFVDIKEANGKDSYTFTVSDEMDGWVIRCSALAGNVLRYVLVEKTYTINVIEKKVRIEEQPENEQMIYLDRSDKVSFSVKARNATHYQWQVSKRPYVNSKGYGFEDIPGANSPTYSYAMNSVTRETMNYVYRCVVSNDYSEVISDEVYCFVYEAPGVENVNAKMKVGVGDTASAEVSINTGYPAIANTFYWEVSKDGGATYESLSAAMGDIDYELFNYEWTIKPDNIQYTSHSTLTIEKAEENMDGWLFRYTLIIDGKTFQEDIRLTLHEHIWTSATCSAPETCTVDGCNATRGEKLPHSYSSKLTYNSESHWYECTECGDKKNETAHSYHDNCDPSCIVCGRKREALHDFELMTSENEHWYKCRECNTESGRQTHYYDNDCDADCNLCERTRAIAHSYEWQHNDEKHWQQCSKCGDKKNEAGHSFTAENTDSKYLKSAASCTKEAEFYKSCELCGLSSQGTSGEAAFTANGVLGHDYGEWKSNKNGTHTHTCKKDASHSETENCTGGTANCKSRAVCEVCNDEYGDLNPNRHTDEAEWIISKTEHAKVYKCCNKTAVAKEAHEWVNGICSECQYHCVHQLEWKKENGEYWSKCKYCGAETKKKPVPEIIITGSASVCKTQDYIFSFTLPEGATDVTYGFEFNGLGNGSNVPTYENGIFGCIIRHTDYEYGENSFKLTVSAKTAEGIDFFGEKTVAIQNEHHGGTVTCKDKAVCETCKEKYGEPDADNHTDLKHFPAKAATKKEKGNIEYWYCSSCNKYFSNSEATQEIAKADTVTEKLPNDEDNTGGSGTGGNSGTGGGSGTGAGGNSGKADTGSTGSNGTGGKDNRSDGNKGNNGTYESGEKHEDNESITKKNSGTSPKTGDISSVAFWVFLALISGAFIIATVIRRKLKPQKS